MSDVEDDSISLRISLRSQDPSLTSVSESKRSSLSNFIFSFDRDVTGSKLIAASTQPSSSDVQAPLVGSKEAASNAKPVAKVSPKIQSSGLSHIFHKPFGKLSIPGHRRLSLAPFKGIVRSPSAFPPVIKVSRSVDVKQEQRSRVESDRVKVLLLGAGCSGKTTLWRSIELLCTGKIQHLPQWLASWLMAEDVKDRMLQILSFVEEAGLPLNFEDDGILQTFLKGAEPSRTLDERIAYNKEDSIAFSSERPNLEELSRKHQLSSAAGKLWADKRIRAAFDTASREVYTSKDTALYVRRSTRTPDADMK